jgi:predicted DNA-binding transcriptional regulator AlpA
VALVKLLRYPELLTAGIIKNRVDLGSKIKFYGFPPGRLLGPNTRAWTEPEVMTWWDSRPVERAPDAIPREQRFDAHKAKAAQPTEPPVPPKAARSAAAKTPKVQAKRSVPKRRPRQ